MARILATWLLSILSLMQRRWDLTLRVVLAAIALGAVVMTLWTNLPIIAMQATIGVAGAVVPAAIAGISLGLVGHRLLDRRAGRNESFSPKRLEMRG